MLRRTSVPLVALLACLSLAQADLGLADVLAVCRVTLRTGRQVEGVVLVASGGYDKHLSTNGFFELINDSMNSIPLLFGRDFGAFEPRDGIVNETLGSGARGRRFKATTYFLYDMSQRAPSGLLMDIRNALRAATDTTVLLLTRDISHHLSYELLRYVPLYPTIPPKLLGSWEDPSAAPEKLAVKDIARFELVRDPSADWVKQIAAAESTYSADHAEDPDMFLPTWYHRIVNDSTYDNLFRPWEY
jgi:hypothetical protein